MPVLDKIANIGEGRKLKNLTDLAKLVNTYEPEVEDLSDDELRENDGRVQGTRRERRGARRPPARGLRGRP